MNLFRTFSASVLFVAALTSCATPAKVSEERDANGNKIEYVYYTPVGSNIPIKVRKDQVQTSDTDVAAAEKALLDAQMRSSETPKAPGGK